MIVTSEIIERGKSVRGGWNLQQVEALGFNGWEYKWKKRAIGKDVDPEKIKLFLLLKDAHTNGIPKENRAKKAKELVFEPVSKEIKYVDQYKHPNWQKMRLIVLKRDGFKCVNCHAKDKTLHAHHLKYSKSNFIWNVPHWYIVTLCEDCHSEEHNRDLRIKPSL